VEEVCALLNALLDIINIIVIIIIIIIIIIMLLVKITGEILIVKPRHEVNDSVLCRVSVQTKRLVD